MVQSKKKGNRGENLWANWLTSNGITAYRNSGSGSGIAKSDVHNALGANFEVKTVKHLNLKKAWQQSQSDANKAHSTPYLVVHLDGMKENDWFIVMNNYDWLDLMKKSIEQPTPQNPNRELRYKGVRAVQAINDFLKEFKEPK